MKKQNRKTSFIDMLITVAIVIMLGGLGFIVGIVLGKSVITENSTSGWMSLVVIFVIFVISFIVQIILHEAGHLIGGLLSGYEFVSFRVGSITLIKENGKFAIKKFKIKGTAGQCLMMPKEENYNEAPYILYNLGGILINAIISILAIIMYSLFDFNNIINVVLLSIFLSGVIIVITNGIPMKIGGIANDGYNVIAIGKSTSIKYYLYIQLKVNGLIYKGVRIKDMPVTWFNLEENCDLNNPLVTSIKCLEANYYHDKKEFSKAKECYEDLLNKAPNIMKIYENEIRCELLFYEIIGEKREDIINKLYTKELKQYIKATDCYITRKRLMYAYSKMIERDLDKANKILNEIEVVKKTYPAKAEVESELEIINLIKAI